MSATGRGGGHVEIVAEHDSTKTELATQDAGNPAPGKSCGTAIKAFVHDVRGHDARKVGFGETLEWNQILDLEILVRTAIHGQCVVRVGRDASVSGEVLSDAADACLAHPRQERARQHGDHVGIAMECAVADDRAHAAAQIEHRGKAEVDPAGAQLRSHDPAARAGGAARELRIPIVQHPVLRGRGKSAESVPEALHPPAFVIDRDERRRPSRAVDLVAQGPQLLAVAIVARKQNDAPDGGMVQHVPLDLVELETGDADHERSERH